MFNFSKREINVLTIGSIFLIVFVAVQFIYSPMIDKRNNLKRILAQKQTSLKEMVSLQQQFLAVSNNFDTQADLIINRKKGFSLFSLLDTQAQQSGVKENVAYMKPITKKIENSVYSLAIVQVSLKQVYLKELVDFLYRIEASNNGVTITSLSLTKAGKEETKLDAIIEAQTPMPMEKS